MGSSKVKSTEVLFVGDVGEAIAGGRRKDFSQKSRIVLTFECVTFRVAACPLCSDLKWKAIGRTPITCHGRFLSDILGFLSINTNQNSESVFSTEGNTSARARSLGSSNKIALLPRRSQNDFIEATRLEKFDVCG